MQNPKYVVNLIDLQNIQTSLTGQNPVSTLQSMVNYPTKTVNTNFISNFTTGNSISVQADMITSNLTVLGTLITSNFVSSNSNLFVSGDLGESTVYDTLYNPPVVAVPGPYGGNRIYQFGPFVAGSNNGTLFTVPQSGIYQLQTRLRVGGSAPIIETAGYIKGYLFNNTTSLPVDIAQQTISGSGIVGPDPSSDSVEYIYNTNTNLTSNTVYNYIVLSRNGVGGAGAWDLGTQSLFEVFLYRLS